MDDARRRILELEFDHDVFRMWPAGHLLSAEEVVHDRTMLTAAIERLETISATHEQPDLVAAMVNDCCERMRTKLMKIRT